MQIKLVLFFCFFRNHRLEIGTSSLHDAGDYTFVPEGYSQSLSAKLHIIGIKAVCGEKKTKRFFWFFNFYTKFFIYGVFYRSTKSAFGKLELPRQHSHYSGREQATSGGPNQWRTSTQSGVDEGRKGRLSFFLIKRKIITFALLQVLHVLQFCFVSRWSWSQVIVSELRHTAIRRAWQLTSRSGKTPATTRLSCRMKLGRPRPASRSRLWVSHHKALRSSITERLCVVLSWT